MSRPLQICIESTETISPPASWARAMARADLPAAVGPARQTSGCSISRPQALSLGEASQLIRMKRHTPEKMALSAMLKAGKPTSPPSRW